jgi:hypothetical protein
MNHVCRVDYFEGKQVMFSKAWFAYPRMTFSMFRSLVSKRNWLLSIFAIALGMLHTSSMAQQCTSSGGTISTAVTTQCALTSGTLTITGTGSISTTGNGSNNDAINTSGTTTINNNGSISTSGSDAYGVYTSGTITTLNNTGSISTLATLGTPAFGIGNSGTITTLNNTGSISTVGIGAFGIGNFGTITTLNNTGLISTSGSGAYGISNYGSITTLNNQQGKSGNSPLTFSGRLPTNYNIIIASSTNYGQLSIFTPSSKMVFSISSLSSTNSSIVGQTLTGVLQGFGSNLSTYLNNPTGTSSNGYTYSFSQQGSTGNWDMTITACSICVSPMTNITSGSSVQISSIGVTANPVLAGGTLVLNQGGSSSTSISITSAGGTIQSPSSGEATLSGVFTGTGGLTFTGAGSTIMSGSNTYSGGTTVSGGTLVVAGTAPTGTGDVFVASAGTLMGTGTIAGNSIVSGVIKPGNSPGYLSVAQNVTLNSGST